MSIKLTKLSDSIPTGAGVDVTSIEVRGETCHPNAGYLLHLLIESHVLENDNAVVRPTVAFITDEIRLFTFTLHGVIFIYRVEIFDTEDLQKKCTKCGINEPKHSIGDKRNLCCKCYVEEGFAPASWHSGCLA